MHTLATFYASFPEFADGGAPQNALVQTKLDEAELDIDPAVWGAKATIGHGYLTAHLLAMTPLGNTAKLVADKTTTYEINYRRQLGIVAAGIRST